MGIPFTQKSDNRSVLDFDIENRPLSYWYDGNCTAQITAICVGWVGNHTDYDPGNYKPSRKVVDTWTVHWTDMENAETLKAAYTRMHDWFLGYYNEADAVTGHFIRKHDLAIINMEFVKMGLPMLPEKDTIDTKLDMRRCTMPKSQEALGAMLSRLPQFKHLKYLGKKEHVTQAEWQEANSLVEEGVRETFRRVEGDVRQHREILYCLQELKYLNPGKVWQP